MKYRLYSVYLLFILWFSICIILVHLNLFSQYFSNFLSNKRIRRNATKNKLYTNVYWSRRNSLGSLNWIIKITSVRRNRWKNSNCPFRLFLSRSENVGEVEYLKWRMHFAKELPKDLCGVFCWQVASVLTKVILHTHSVEKFKFHTTVGDHMFASKPTS